MPPPPRRGPVALIIAMSTALIMLIAMTGTGLWLIAAQTRETVSDTAAPTSSGTTGPGGSPTPSGGTERNGATEQAANTLTVAFSFLDTAGGTERFCDQAFAYGRDMVYLDRAECVQDWDGVFSHFPESERARFSTVTIPPSTLHQVDDDTLAVRWSEVDAATDRSAVSEALAEMELGLVLRRDTDPGSWTIIGTTMDDDELGTVPDGARQHLVGPGTVKSV
jgi:hypothetical protein